MRPATRTTAALHAATLAALVGFTVPAPSAMADTLHVPSEYATIQMGLDAGVAGDTVLVAPGTYTDAVDRDGYSAVAHLPGGIHLVSEGGPAVTTLDRGNPPNGSNRPVVAGVRDGSTRTIVDGFTLVGAALGSAGLHLWPNPSGTEVEVRNCVFEELDALNSDGGGIRCLGASLTTEDTVFHSCRARRGAGIYLPGGGEGHTLTVRTCTFEACDGGGIRSENNELGVYDSVFLDNSDSWGGGISANSAILVVAGCRFEGNEATQYGGGAILVAGPPQVAEVTIQGNIFLFNRTSGTSRGGGAIHWDRAEGIVEGNTIHGSSTLGVPGSAVSTAGSHGPLFRANVITGSEGAVAVFADGEFSPECNVFWANLWGENEGYELAPSDRIVDPLYCDPLSDDLRLQPGSPCIPANSQGCGLIGALDIGCAKATIIVTTSPPGITIDIDGIPVATPATFDWSPGTTHELSAHLMLPGPGDSRYVFESWSDGGAATHTIVAPDGPITYAASYGIEIPVDVIVGTFPDDLLFAADGTPHVGGETLRWFPESEHELAAISPQPGGVGTEFVFDFWSDGGDSAHSIVVGEEDASYTVHYRLAAQEGVLLNTEPVGLSLVVDSVMVSTPVHYEWSPGSAHEVTASTPQEQSYQLVWAFTQWNDGADTTRTVVTPPEGEGVTLTAIYQSESKIRTALTTTPVSLALLVDGQVRQTPHSALWPRGTVHSLEAFEEVPGQLGRIWVWQEWSDGGPRSRSYLVPAEPESLAAAYEEVVLPGTVLQTNVGGARITVDGSDVTLPAFEPWEAGSEHALHAPTFQTIGGSVYRFLNWGDGEDSPDRQWIQAPGQDSLLANFLFDDIPAITVSTAPTAERITVDEVEFQSPKTFFWDPGTRHTIAVDTLVVPGERERRRFVRWNDGVRIPTRTITVPQGNATYTANYAVWFDVQTSVDPAGTVTPPSGWYLGGEPLEFSATPPAGFYFLGWEGTYPVAENPFTVTLESPVDEVAKFIQNAYEITLSLSDSDPFAHIGSPIGIGEVYLWFICTDGSGMRTLSGRVSGSMPALAFLPSSGIVSAAAFPGLDLYSTVCLTSPAVLGHFVVNDASGGDLCLSSGSDGPPALGDCTLSEPAYSYWPAAVKITGVATDGGAYCVSGRGCGEVESPVSIAVSGLKAIEKDDAVEISWSTSNAIEHDGFRIRRASQPYSAIWEPIHEGLLRGRGVYVHVDETTRPSTTYWYRLGAVDTSGRELSYGPVSVTTAARLPLEVTLDPLRPNPLRGSAELRFALPQPGPVDLSVYDVAGRRVSRVVTGTQPAGRYDLRWEARDSRGRRLAAGVYFLRLVTPNESRVRKVVVLGGE